MRTSLNGCAETRAASDGRLVAFSRVRSTEVIRASTSANIIILIKSK